MAEIESDVNQERQLAKTLMELREVFTRAKMLLPAVSLSEMLMLAGAVEQAKTSGMKTRGTKTKAAPLPKAVVDDLYAGEFPLRNALTVSIGKERVHMAVAAAKILADSPLTVRELLNAIVERGWKVNSQSENLMQIVRALLDRHPKHFASTRGPGKQTMFRVKGQPVEARAKAGKTSWRKKQDENAKSREQIVRALGTLHEPITIAALGEKLGRTNGAGLVPVLVSLHHHGALKKTNRGGETFWAPVKDKLKTYAPRVGRTSESMLNGAAHA